MKIIRTADHLGVDGTFDLIKNMMEQEKEYRNHSAPIPAMEEATPEDLDAGYGRGMSAMEYRRSLQHPFVELIDKENTVVVKFYGNHAPSSVNAGMDRRVFIDELSREEAKELTKKLERANISVL